MRTRIMILIVGLLVVAACSDGSATADPTDRAWELTELEGSAPVDGTSITMTLEDDTVFGSAGCNNYNGPAEVGEGTLTLGPNLATTMMACEQPIMDQETAYLDALSRATAFEMAGDTLSLLDGEGTVLAVFE